MENKVTNMTESLVRDKLEELLVNYDGCKCNQCCEDIVAFALNQLPVRYVNTNREKLLAKLEATDFQVIMDTEVAIIKAMDVVKLHPRHDD